MPLLSGSFCSFLKDSGLFRELLQKAYFSAKVVRPNSEFMLQYWASVFQRLGTRGSGLEPKIVGATLKASLGASSPPIDMIHAGFKLYEGKVLPELVTRQVISFYKTLQPDGKREFLLLLAKEFGVSNEAVARAASACLSLQSPDSSRAVARSHERLRSALTPLYTKFFAQIIMEDDGLLFLHELRAELLGFIKEDPEASFSLRQLDDHLKHQLQSWYSAGFLTLGQVSWESPVSIIEYIQANEAVHPVQDWRLLKKRLIGNRKCFAFFHQSLPLEPVAFIMVALMDQIPTSMAAIESSWSSCEPKAQKVAVFYSISSTQRGLSGIDLGASLIKSVVPVLCVLYPWLTLFSTLSPIPGFRGWLKRLAADTKSPELKPFLQASSIAVSELESHRSVLMELCYRYLYEEKIRGRALDPVANFHLCNGASFWRLNWLADTSARGLSQSFGIMANYYYDLAQTASNSQAYMMDGVISTRGPPEP